MQSRRKGWFRAIWKSLFYALKVSKLELHRIHSFTMFEYFLGIVLLYYSLLHLFKNRFMKMKKWFIFWIDHSIE